MKTRFTSGEFAKISKVSIHTLRYYDKMGIFKPKIVNPETKYRYYIAEQLEELDFILVLKEMGLSLEEMKETLKSRTIDSSLRQLKDQQRALTKEIERLKHVREGIDYKLKSIEEIMKLDLTVIKVESLPERELEYAEVKSPYGENELSHAFTELINGFKDSGRSLNRVTGVILRKEALLKGEFECYKAAHCEIDPWEKATLKRLTLPQQNCLVAWHQGAYEKLPETYGKMMKYISKNNLKVCGDAIERSFIDLFIVSDMEELVTEITIPVEGE